MTPGLSPFRTVLPNGVTVIAKQTSRTPAVTISLALRAGGVVDPREKPGAMYLLGRIIDRGTRARSAAAIADALDSRGVSVSISVSRHLFSIVCTCLSEDFDPIFDLLGDIITAPTLPESELAIRRTEVITSLRQDADSPAVRAVEAFRSALYGPAHPYGRPLKGTLESIEEISREDLVGLHRTCLGPSHLMVVVVGDVEPTRVEDRTAAAFAGWSGPPRAEVTLIPALVPAQRRQLTIPMMNKAQTDIAYGFPSIARVDPTYYAFLLMNNVLGQYALGGRLGDSIRERQGMAYYVSSSFEASVIPGPFLVRAGVAAQNVAQAIDSIDHELHVLRSRGVTGKELADSRQYLIGSMPRALETNAGIAAFLQNAEFFDLGLDYDRRLPGLLTAVTLDEVNAAATSLDPERATIVVAGPYDGPAAAN
jgi:zinc protease